MISALDFLDSLNWIDGKPLQVETYRRDIFRRAFDERGSDGRPRYNMVLCGRGKKNHKSADLILASLYVLMWRDSVQGSDVLIAANDEDQAGQDLDLAKKIVAANPALADELHVYKDEIARKDGKGTMRVLPAGNIVGQHGKTAAMIGYDEIHAYKNWDLLEALAPDPTRYTLQWVTSYDSIFDVEGCPLHDLKVIGMRGDDPRMLFSWYSGDYTTDINAMRLPPEQRANPSMASWPEGRGYLDQQRRRLPSSKFRRLHLNLPGAVQGAFYDQSIVERAIITGRQVIEPQDGIDYVAHVDMSGGSNDDATLAIAHWDGAKAVLDLLIEQDGSPPFNPRLAVARFAVFCKRYRCKEVHGDAYAGQTFRSDFSDCGIDYVVEKRSRTDLYEDLEVALNANQVELLDQPKLKRQLLTIVRRGASLDHLPGQHDDHVTSAAGALTLANPDLGAETPNILEFYRRQSEALTQAKAAPQKVERHAFTQTGGQRVLIKDPVRIVLPQRLDVSTVLGGVTGLSHNVELDSGDRVVWISREDAVPLLTSGTSHALPFIEANRKLAEELRSALPPAGPIIRFDDLRPHQPRSPFDIGGIAHDTLRMCGIRGNW